MRLGNPALVDAVCNEVLDGDNTAWDDIAGQVSNSGKFAYCQGLGLGRLFLTQDA